MISSNKEIEKIYQMKMNKTTKVFLCFFYGACLFSVAYTNAITFVRNASEKNNGTVNWLLKNLVDYGFYWIGVGDYCREHAVCLSARDFGQHLNGYVSEDKFVSVPHDILGNHELTYAWLIGMQSMSTDICHQLYECSSSKQ